MKYVFLSIILFFVLMSGCAKRKDFGDYIKGAKVIRKAIVKNYPNSLFPKTIFGFRSYNIVRKTYLLTIPDSLRAYGVRKGDTILLIDHIKFQIQTNRYDFFLAKYKNKYVYIDHESVK